MDLLHQGTGPNCHMAKGLSPESLTPTWLWTQAEPPGLGPHPGLPAQECLRAEPGLFLEDLPDQGEGTAWPHDQPRPGRTG